VPLTVAVHEIKFNQKVTLQSVVIEPYAKSSEGTSFTQVVLRCTAKTIFDDSIGKSAFGKTQTVYASCPKNLRAEKAMDSGLCFPYFENDTNSG